MASPVRGSRSFETRLDIAVPPEDVWHALTTPEGITRWFATHAEVRPGVGGSLLWKWEGLHDWPLEITAWAPGSHLGTRYRSSVPDGAGGHHPLFVDFHLEGRSGGTVLRVVHSGFGPDAAFDQEFDGISRGWLIELMSLRHALEKHAGEDRHLAWVAAPIAPAARDMEHGWRLLLGPDGFAAEPRAALASGLAEGDSFRLRVSAGEVFECEVLRNLPHELCGVARSHGDGFVRVAVERCGETEQAWVWLALYGKAGARAAEIREQLASTLARVFPARSAVRETEGSRR